MNDYERIETLIRYLDQHRKSQPELADLAAKVDLSPPYLQRLFARWAGITPKKFLQCLTVAHAKNLLRAGENVLDATYEVGLSGPSRLHDLCVTLEAATPGEIQSGGKHLELHAGWVDTPFGNCLIADSARGICHLSFNDSADREFGKQLLAEDWPRAAIIWKPKNINELAQKIFPSESSHRSKSSPLKTYVGGTEFQVHVWRALLRIPTGTLVSYGQIAQAVGNPKACRAVGTAVGQNRISYLIPCHRVIRETGVLGNYRWGSHRKKSMLIWESR